MFVADEEEIVLEKYKILEWLGGAGQSLVYRAENIDDKKAPLWKKTVFIKQYTDLTPPEKEF